MVDDDAATPPVPPVPPVPPMPAALGRLLADGGAGRTLPVALPPGRLVVPDPDFDRGDGTPAYWLSDGPAATARWSQLHAAHPQSGLWPLLLRSLDGDPARPWHDGEVDPQPTHEIDRHDAATFLATIWADMAQNRWYIGEGFEDLAPFGRDWPGLAPPGEPTDDPEVVADRCAQRLRDRKARLGLAAAERGADTLARIGWLGPCNYAETPPLAAVVRSWEDRFGVRVVRVGFDTLDLSVAAPPVTAEHALHVAAEHYAFCPDNIEQGWADVDDLASYAERIRGQNSWSFWWD
jgi:hypothetical protein